MPLIVAALGSSFQPPVSRMKGNEGVGNKLIIIMKLISTGFKVYSPPFPKPTHLLISLLQELSAAVLISRTIG